MYNGSSSYHNPITFGEMKEYSIDGWIKYPAWEVMWCPSCETTNNSWYFRINVAISHYVPAYIFDLLSRLRGKRGKLVRTIPYSYTFFLSLNITVFCYSSYNAVNIYILKIFFTGEYLRPRF